MALLERETEDFFDDIPLLGIEKDRLRTMTNTCTHTYIRTYVHTYVRTYEFIRVDRCGHRLRKCVCVCVCLFVFLYTRRRTHTLNFASVGLQHTTELAPGASHGSRLRSYDMFEHMAAQRGMNWESGPN